jgi:AraC-like DNA-binding protein
MLFARATKTLRAARFTSYLVFAPRVWMSIVERVGLTLDTRFAPVEKDAPRPGACLYFIHRGTFAFDGETFEGPVTFLMSTDHMKGARGAHTVTFRTSGEPFEAIEMYLAEEDVTKRLERGPAAVEVDDRAREAVARMLRVAHATSNDTRELESAVDELLGALAAQRLIAAGVVDASRSPMKFEKLWRAVRPLAERFALTATMDELGVLAEASPRTLDRYVRDFLQTFTTVGGGFRAATVYLRLRLAVMFLSAEGVTVAEVAHAIGYGSADAMARAFRDAGLPAPTALRDMVLQSRA